MDEQQQIEPSTELVLAEKIETAVQHLKPEVISQIKSLTLKLKLEDGTELDIPISEINMGSSAKRPAPEEEETRYGIKTGPQLGWMRCGNCLMRLPRFADQTINHHTMQEHHQFNCEKRAAAQLQHNELLADFRRQEEQQSPETKALRAAWSQPERPFLSEASPRRVEGIEAPAAPAIAPADPLDRAAEELVKQTAAKPFVWWKPWTWF